MENRSNELVIREFPFLQCLFGFILIGISVFTYQSRPDQIIVPILTAALGVLIFSLAAILIVTADRATGILTIQRISLLRRYKREIPLSDIFAIQLEHSLSSSSSSSGRTSVYRIVVVTKNQEVIPFRNSYSSSQWPKETKAKKLREFLGVGGEELSLGSLIKIASGQAVTQFKEEQEAITGNQETENVTDGIHWNLETQAMGVTPVSRWFSPDFSLDGNFIYITQKMVGQGSQSGLMAMVGKLLFKTSLSLYGFTGDLTPGLDSGEVFTSLNPQLDQHFMVFTSWPGRAQQVLNSWVTVPLAKWAEKYPLTKGNTSQLAVLFCPQGVYLATMGLVNPEFLQELTSLGIELVKAQGIK